MFQHFTPSSATYYSESVDVFASGNCFAHFNASRDYATLTLITYPEVNGTTLFDSSHPDAEQVEFPVANIEIANRILSAIRASRAVVAPF